MSVPRQSEHWMDFYEAAWAARARVIEGMIAAGERHPYRLIKRLEALERRFELFHGREGGGDCSYEPREVPAGNALPCGTPAFRTASVHGQLVPTSYHADACLTHFLVDYLDHTGPYDAVIELGCGYARNLFGIWYCGGPSAVPYFGGEFTGSGVDIARRLAELSDDLDFRFFRFDHKAPDLSAVPRVRRAFVFTLHSIEQVTEIDVTWFAAAAGLADEVVGVNLEPFGFQVQDLGEPSRLQRAMFLQRGWNLNLAQTIIDARDAGVIAVDFMGTELFLSDRNEAANPTSLALWHAPA